VEVHSEQILEVVVNFRGYVEKGSHGGIAVGDATESRGEEDLPDARLGRP